MVATMPLRDHLARTADTIDRFGEAIGRTVAWAVAVMVVGQLAIAILRYALGFGSIRLQESVVYAHASLVMLGAAWTLAKGGHVRVDIFYADASPRRRALVDLVGTLVFLLPFCVATLWLSAPYVARSWALLERSREASGLPLVFLLKSLIPAFAILMGAQGVARAIRAALVLAPARAAM
jgi:TRAP-type mannitol/chloroaromatic compound transport system permease small subunit